VRYFSGAILTKIRLGCNGLPDTISQFICLEHEQQSKNIDTSTIVGLSCQL